MYLEKNNKNKRNILIRYKQSSALVLFTLAWFFCLLSPHIPVLNQARAEVAKMINYQGKLTDSTGYPVSDGNYDMRFRAYDSASGGNLLWTGTHTTANGNPIATSNGIFSILLGSGTGNALDLDFTSGEFYLQVEIYNSGTSSWETFNNRKQMASVPQALNANNLVGDGRIDLDNTDAAQDAVNISYNPTAGNNDALEVTYGSGGGIGTALKIIQEGTGNIMSLFDGADEVLRVADGGNVGIGTTDPSFKLDISGGDINTGGTYRMGGLDYGQYFIDGAGLSGQIWMSDGTTRGAWNNQSAIDHGSLGGLSDDDHSQYALLSGRSGGQNLIGGTNPDDKLTFQGNSASSGNQATETNIEFKVGNSGSTSAMSIYNSGDVDFHNNEAKQFRVENADSSVLSPSCDGTTLGRMYYDTSAGSAFVCIESAPGVYGWFDYTSTTVQSNKVVTVGTGGDYTSISAGAGYLNALGGGIILLTPETHNVTSAVDLENISLIGANTGDTRVNITGAGRLRVKETQFKSMTIYVDAGLVASSGIDAKYNALTTSSIIFEWVDFITNGTKVLVNSTDATAPTVRTRFISTSTTSGTQKIFLPRASANLNAASTHFVESQGGSGTLDIEDWNVKIAGSSNVKTSGTIETIPDSTIFVYPGMNLQGAINSISTGGVITLLPGVHTTSSTILITKDDIQIEGYGDASVIQASGFTGGDTVAAIQIGAVNGSTPNDGVVLRDFKLEVSGTGASDIHGIRVAGGEDNQLQNISIVKTAGSSGTAAGARMGVLMMDGTGEKLVRPVIKGCRVLGTSSVSAYFTDGIHVTGGATYGAGSGIWTNGQGIDGALVDGNYVDYVRETVAVFVGVNNSSLYNNRFSRMGAGGGGAFGVFFGNASNVNMTANVVATSLSTASYGIVIDTINSGSLKQVTDSVFTANTVDGSANGGVGFAYGVNIGATANTGFHRNVFTNNVINGASNATTYAINVTGNADDNNFSNNIINGVNNAWDTGLTIATNTADRNFIGKNAFITTTANIADAGTSTQLSALQHNAAVNPTVNEDSADGYAVGAIWVNTATGNAYIATNVTVGAANWEQLDAVGGGSADLDIAYTNDLDKIMNVNNVAGLEFLSTSTGNMIFDLQSTGDLLFQDNNATFLTIDDLGGLAYTLDAVDNPSFAINNLGTGSFMISDESGDVTPFVIDQNGNVGIGLTNPTDKLNVSQAISSTSADGIDVAYSQTTNAANISGAALQVTASSSGDAGDTLYGVNIDNINPNASSQIGQRFGSGWDYELAFDDATPNIRFVNGAELNITDGTNNLLTAKDLNTNFGMYLNGGAFIDRNSSIQEEFNKYRATRTADTAGAAGAGFGDGGGWGVYEGACNFSSLADSVNGIVRMQTTAANNGCLMMMDEAANNRRDILDADNLPVFQMKVRPSNVGANNVLFVGEADQTDGVTTDPANFIGFTNDGGNVWTGRTTNGGTTTDVPCAGQTISTTQFALLMIEVRSTTDVRFYVDNDVSDGINYYYCGQSTNNVPTANYAPQLVYQVRTGGTANQYLDVDFYRVWQDDSASGVQIAEGSISEAEMMDQLNLSDMEIEIPVVAGTDGTELITEGQALESEGISYGLKDLMKLQSVMLTNAETGEKQMGFNTDAVKKIMPNLVSEKDGENTMSYGQLAALLTKSIQEQQSDLEGVKLAIGTSDAYEGTEGLTASVDTLIAKNIQADRIEGIEFIQKDLTSIETDLAQGQLTTRDLGKELTELKKIVDALSKSMSESELLALASQSLNNQICVDDDCSASKLTAPIVLGSAIIKDLETQGGLVVGGTAEFRGPVIFKAVAEFLDRTIFRDSVEFAKEATFQEGINVSGGITADRNTAGVAVLEKGKRKVEVKFETEYKLSTVVVVTPRSSIKLDWYRVVNENNEGFEIEIDDEQDKDIEFNWIAIATEEHEKKDKEDEEKPSSASDDEEDRKEDPKLPEETDKVTSKSEDTKTDAQDEELTSDTQDSDIPEEAVTTASELRF